MPLYTYTDNRTGKASVRMVPIAERDRQPGLTRVLEFATARLGVAENPHTQEAGVRRGLRDMEEKYGPTRIERETGMSMRQLKKVWNN